MKMMFSRHARRRAILAVIAEIMLIAIILVEAVVVGYAFGLLGSFTNTAEVSVSVMSCNGKANVLTCTFTARNTGSGSTSITGISVIQGATYKNTNATAVRVGVGQTVSFTRTWTLNCTRLTAGTHITGAAELTNGGSALFWGTTGMVS